MKAAGWSTTAPTRNCWPRAPRYVELLTGAAPRLRWCLTRRSRTRRQPTGTSAGQRPDATLERTSAASSPGVRGGVVDRQAWRRRRGRRGPRRATSRSQAPCQPTQKLLAQVAALPPPTTNRASTRLVAARPDPQFSPRPVRTAVPAARWPSVLALVAVDAARRSGRPGARPSRRRPGRRPALHRRADRRHRPLRRGGAGRLVGPVGRGPVDRPPVRAAPLLVAGQGLRPPAAGSDSTSTSGSSAGGSSPA